MPQITPRHVLHLSPHRDDAAFSSGLLLQQLVASSVSVTVANVCTLSDYAPYFDDPGATVAAISEVRAAEDVAFAADLQRSAALGAEVVMLDLHWRDAPLRRAMPTENVLLTDHAPADEVDRLAGELQQLPSADLVLAPLAIGGHFDHCLVRDAAAAIWPSAQLLFYEDLPYLCRLPAPERGAALHATLPWPSSSRQTAVAAPHTKHRFASHYPSQVAPAVFDELEHYAREQRFTERLHGSPDALHTLAVLLGRHLPEAR